MKRKLPMKKWWILTCLVALYAQANMQNLTNKKQALTPDNTTFDYGQLHAIADWKGFQLPFANTPLFVSKNMGLLLGYPAIGVYNAEGYNLRKKLIMATIPVKAFMQALPMPLQKMIHGFVNIDIVKNSTASFIALGTVMDQKADSPDQSYNIVFHPWAGLRYINNDSINFFEENVPMGIFEADGVQELGDKNLNSNSPMANLSFNQLSAKNINWHAPAHMSPNNAQFRVVPGRQFATFLAIALTPDNSHLSLTYFLLANSKEAELLIARSAQKANTFNELDQYITELLLEAPFSAEDKNTVNQWLSTMYAAITA